ncbi:tumor protein p53-inducible nuclear protein 2 isoform X1 [Centroberyx affinis]|uniref:tumor protein p53-inducible nuclear protein 2 isoform X1 n=1 Tax=Centroberyx affinis TaxID=166261 RepID=UPI003A5C2198
MFQRLSSLFFGEVEEVAAELKGPNPCVTEADEEGWMLVNLPGEADGMVQVEGERDAPLIAQSFPDSNQSNHQDTLTRTECPAPIPHPPHKRRRTHKGRAQDAVVASSDPLSCPSASPSDLGAATPVTLPRRARLSTPSTPSMSPGSGSECGGSGGSSRAGSERGCMDESWFVTPPPCFTAEGATAEASPMEDLLIEHPSMSVYVSPNNLSMVSNGNLSVVGEESIVSLASSVSRVAEPAAAPATRGTMPTRVSRGAAAQAGALAKVTQVARVQRGKARIERRHLGRNRIQRQNRTREQVPRHAAHARNTFLHQPSQRNFCH